jgi:hypothetical protein
MVKMHFAAFWVRHALFITKEGVVDSHGVHTVL